MRGVLMTSYKTAVNFANNRIATLEEELAFWKELAVKDCGYHQDGLCYKAARHIFCDYQHCPQRKKKS